jgi:hypothetical protein
MPAKGVTVYLPADLEAELLKAAKTKHLSASGIIAVAVKQRFKTTQTACPKVPHASLHAWKPGWTS